MVFFRSIACILTSFFCLHLVAQNGKDDVKVTDLLEMKSVANVSLNSDGKKIAYTVTSILSDEKKAGDYKYQSQIWVAQTSGAMPHQQFTTSDDGAGQPAWSPDGSKLAFIRGVEGVSQIFIAQMGGGEPVQITRLKTGASNPVWSPDGKLIAFTSSFSIRGYINDSLLNPQHELPLFSMEKPGLKNDFLHNNNIQPNANGSLDEVRAYLFKNEIDKIAKVFNKLNFQQESVTSSDMNVNHIFLVEPVAGAKPRAVTKGFLSFSNPQFIAGSPLMVVEAPYYRKYHPDRTLERAIFTVDTSGANLKLLVGDSGLVCSGASVSPSGKWIAYQKGVTSFVSIPELYIEALSPDAKPVKIEYNRNKGNIIWSDDDRFLYFTSPSNGGVVLNRYEVKNKDLKRLTDFEEGVSAIDVKVGTLAIVKNSVARPSELYISDLEAKNARQISSHNSWVKDKKLSIPEKFTFKNELGQEVEYWVMKPTDYVAGKKYPLLLEIHGGPTAMWGPGEPGMWHEYQYFCSKGYGIVYANPRGSGGYGEAFMRSIINDWGNGPMRDVLTALDKTVAAGWADTSKLLVTGGSYAGYLIAYILGHDQRFAAACSQRGVYDLRTFFGEGNAWRLIPNYFGGYPWEKTTYDVLERESPINYVQNIKTPLIIFHGEQDLRTGVIQSEQLYKSLKVLGRPVEYVRHPGATHEITRSGNNRQRIDQMLRTWEFFERYLREEDTD
jgi:dipeptidyl aminopeptidase/acylaminoacyl peptidase